ncbi:hypothetical protein G6011_00816 [Alternaria panax]|uniref:Uncharacterized protein n=1 Tax=Alternaria panax TaxID=48097 RepID=A0AAD4IJM4_9PLEO|nr:hypothetical protein G6011_00816 [Alternaria panax]
MDTPLMDRRTFLDQGIKRDLMCSICYIVFTNTHEVRRIDSPLHFCKEVYYDDCLPDHIEVNNNTCPDHANIALFELLRKPAFVSGEREAANALHRETHGNGLISVGRARLLLRVNSFDAANMDRGRHDGIRREDGDTMELRCVTLRADVAGMHEYWYHPALLNGNLWITLP